MFGMEITKQRRGRPVAPITVTDYPVRLREFRERAGLSQNDLAEFLGLSQYSISVAERTGKELADAHWQRLAVLFKTDVLTLRGWSKIYSKI